MGVYPSLKSHFLLLDSCFLYHFSAHPYLLFLPSFCFPFLCRIFKFLPVFYFVFLIFSIFCLVACIFFCSSSSCFLPSSFSNWASSSIHLLFCFFFLILISCFLFLVFGIVFLHFYLFLLSAFPFSAASSNSSSFSTLSFWFPASSPSLSVSFFCSSATSFLSSSLSCFIYIFSLKHLQCSHQKS